MKGAFLLKKIAAALLALLLFVSCGKEPEPVLPEEPEKPSEPIVIEPVEPEPELEAEPEPEPEPVKIVDRSREYIYEQNPKLVPVNYDSPALLGLTEDAGEEYTDQLVFLCDSPTYWMGPKGLVPMEHIWTGPEGTQTLAYQSTYKILDPYDNTEKLIRDVVAEHQPEYLVIAIGINGISFMDEDYFKAEYKSLVTDIQTLSPNTKLICQAIYPITPAYKWWGNITNALITEGNQWILEVAEETGCPYLDTFAAILGEDGNAIDDYMRSDGLHPNKEGLTVILDYIRTHAYLPEEE